MGLQVWKDSTHFAPKIIFVCGGSFLLQTTNLKLADTQDESVKPEEILLCVWMDIPINCDDKTTETQINLSKWVYILILLTQKACPYSDKNTAFSSG